MNRYAMYINGQFVNDKLPMVEVTNPATEKVISEFPAGTAKHVHEVETLCCGMVGSFGYKKEYSALSKAIGERLFERISQHPGDVVACGISCRSQIEMGTGRRVLHPVEVLARVIS